MGRLGGYIKSLGGAGALDGTCAWDDARAWGASVGDGTSTWDETVAWEGLKTGAREGAGVWKKLKAGACKGTKGRSLGVGGSRSMGVPGVDRTM